MAGKKPPRSAAGSEKVWGLKQIEQLIDLLIERQVTEFEMEQNGARIRVKRGNSLALNAAAGEGWASDPATASLTPSPAVSSAPAREPLPAVGPHADATPAEPAEDLYVMKSPIVGTFYGAPAPNAPPFVKVGDSVQLGQILCIIEAMKLMNELEAEVAGEIARIYVESGQPVEYGQSLFAIKPSRGQ
jgi:acetyl-CoA carboxylase biotin carboxyl carrier protein